MIPGGSLNIGSPRTASAWGGFTGGAGGGDLGAGPTAPMGDRAVNTSPGTAVGVAGMFVGDSIITVVIGEPCAKGSKSCIGALFCSGTVWGISI